MKKNLRSRWSFPNFVVAYAGGVVLTSHFSKYFFDPRSDPAFYWSMLIGALLGFIFAWEPARKN